MHGYLLIGGTKNLTSSFVKSILVEHMMSMVWDRILYGLGWATCHFANTMETLDYKLRLFVDTNFCVVRSKPREKWPELIVIGFENSHIVLLQKNSWDDK